jgi:hypothetical protein
LDSSCNFSGIQAAILWIQAAILWIQAAILWIRSNLLLWIFEAMRPLPKRRAALGSGSMPCAAPANPGGWVIPLQQVPCCVLRPSH